MVWCKKLPKWKIWVIQNNLRTLNYFKKQIWFKIDKIRQVSKSSASKLKDELWKNFTSRFRLEELMEETMTFSQKYRTYPLKASQQDQSKVCLLKKQKVVRRMKTLKSVQISDKPSFSRSNNQGIQLCQLEIFLLTIVHLTRRNWKVDTRELIRFFRHMKERIQKRHSKHYS